MASTGRRQPAAPPQFRKQPERLADGRRINYYWFVKQPVATPPAADTRSPGPANDAKPHV